MSLAIAATVIVAVQMIEAQAARRLARARAVWDTFAHLQTMLACVPRLDDRLPTTQAGPLAHSACATVAPHMQIEPGASRLRRTRLEVDGRSLTHWSLRFSP